MLNRTADIIRQSGMYRLASFLAPSPPSQVASASAPPWSPKGTGKSFHVSVHPQQHAAPWRISNSLHQVPGLFQPGRLPCAYRPCHS